MRKKLIDINDNLFKVAFSVLRTNWLPCGVATLLLLATEAGAGFFHAPLAFAVVRALVIMIVGHAAYRCLLSAGAVAGWRAAATAEGRIPWRYAGVMLMILSPILVLGIVWTAPGSGIGPSNLAEIGLGLVLVVLYATLYILLGTALPAAAEHGEPALAHAIARGWRNYRAIGRALVFGVWLFRAGTVLVILVLNHQGIPTDFRLPDGSFEPAAAGAMFLFDLSHVFAECLNAVVLTRAYRRHPVPASGTAPQPS